MSSMLEQAIIDAKELKEAAQRNAQEAVIERYQKEIKEAVDKILEQEDLGLDPAAGAEDMMAGDMDMGMDMDAAADPATDTGSPQVEKVLSQLSFLQTGDDDGYVDLNLSKLEEALNIRAEDMLSKVEENIISESLLSELGLFEDDLDEEIELEEELYDEALEEYELEEDYGSDDPYTTESVLEEDELEEVSVKHAFAWAANKYKDAFGGSNFREGNEELEEINLEEDYLDEDLDVFEEEVDLEEETSLEEDDVSEVKYESKRIARKNKSLLREQKKLNNKTQLLEEKLNKYGTVIDKLRDKLNESNLLNAKLLYQNRVLDSISLNERQKDKIVDAIQNANSVEEAKIIFETLQSTVGTRNSKKVPESLNEVVTRSSSAFIPRKEEKRKDNNPFAERMKTLAGLK